mmetsp:Transcript_89519/g.208498  ORF Transcript_89519/g.208498 Transcript_89519/m.208498 type:complete len:301 (-) Transcript_89519:778-1680(-)
MRLSKAWAFGLFVVLINLFLAADVRDLIEHDAKHLTIPHLPLIIVKEGPCVVPSDIDFVLRDGLVQVFQVIVVEHHALRIVVALRPTVCTIAAPVLCDVDGQARAVGLLNPVEQLAHAPAPHVEPSRLGRGHAFGRERVGQRDLVVKHFGGSAAGGVALGIHHVDAVVVEPNGRECGSPLLQQLLFGGRELGEVGLGLEAGERWLHGAGVIVGKAPSPIRYPINRVHEPAQPVLKQAVRNLCVPRVSLIQWVLVVAIVHHGELQLARIFLQNGVLGERMCHDHVVRSNVWPDLNVHEWCH